jgi:hypothetical protein
MADVIGFHLSFPPFAHTPACSLSALIHRRNWTSYKFRKMDGLDRGCRERVDECHATTSIFPGERTEGVETPRNWTKSASDHDGQSTAHKPQYAPSRCAEHSGLHWGFLLCPAKLSPSNHRSLLLPLRPSRPEPETKQGNSVPRRLPGFAPTAPKFIAASHFAFAWRQCRDRHSGPLAAFWHRGYSVAAVTWCRPDRQDTIINTRKAHTAFPFLSSIDL